MQQFKHTTIETTIGPRNNADNNRTMQQLRQKSCNSGGKIMQQWRKYLAKIEEKTIQ